MRRLTILLLLLGLLLAVGAPGASFAGSPVFLVYASHMANISLGQGGAKYPELATLVKKLRSEGKQVILFHGGNFLGPSALSSYDKGAHLIGVLNALEPNVVGLGRREFMHREDELLLRSGEAMFPMVCSNIYDPISLKSPGNTLREYVFPAASPIGFLALVSPEMQVTYIQRRLITVGGYELLPLLKREFVEQGVKFAVATADFMPDSVEEFFNEAGPDLLFVSEAPESRLTMYGKRAMVTHTADGKTALIIRLEPDAEGSYDVAGLEEVNLADYPPDLQVARIVERYAGLFANLSKVVAGKTNTLIDTRTAILRTGENSMGNLVCDALRDYYKSDIALMNSGGIRGNNVYTAGSVLNRGDLQSELPLHDVSCFIEVRGEVLWNALEHGVGQVEEAKGKFLQVSGLSYSFTPKQPPGSRLFSVEVGGKPLDKNKIYSVALPEYFVQHGDGYFMFPSECSRNAPRPEQEVVEIVRVYLAIHSPVSPKLEGRIKRVD